MLLTQVLDLLREWWSTPAHDVGYMPVDFWGDLRGIVRMHWNYSRWRYYVHCFRFKEHTVSKSLWTKNGWSVAVLIFPFQLSMMRNGQCFDLMALESGVRLLVAPWSWVKHPRSGQMWHVLYEKVERIPVPF